MRILLVCFFFCGVVLCEAQRSWVYHPTDVLETLNPSCATSLDDGGVLSCGSGGAGELFWVMRTNGMGVVTWLRTLEVGDVGSSFVLRSCLELSNGGLVLLAVPFMISDHPNELLMIYLTEGGDPLSVKRIQLPAGEFGNIQRATMSIIGSRSSFIQVDQRESYAILKFDAEGELDWARRYEYDGLSVFSGDRSIFHADEDALLVVRNDHALPEAGEIVTRLDTNGVVLWAGSYRFSDSPRIFAVDRAPSGSYVLLGNTHGHGTMHAFAMQMSENGSVDWFKDYWEPDSWSPYSEQVVVLPNAGFLFRAGSDILHTDPDGDLISAQHLADDSLAHIYPITVLARDTALQLIGQARYSRDGWDTFRRAVEMSIPYDEGAQCSVGMRTLLSQSNVVDSIVPVFPTSQEEQITILEESVSSSPLGATVQSLCDFANAIHSKNLDQAPLDVLHLFPIPTRSALQVECTQALVGEQLVIKDGLGREQLRVRLSAGLNNIMVESLSTGIYTAEVRTSSARFFGRIIKE